MTIPSMVEPATGLVIDTVGGGLTTVTSTGALVALRPLLVSTVAVRSCCPERPVASHWTVPAQVC